MNFIVGESTSVTGVILAAVVGFITGAIYFGPKTMYPRWWKALGKSPAENPGGNMGLTFGAIFLAQLVQAFALAFVLQRMYPSGVSAIAAAIVGACVALGLNAAPSLGHRLMGNQGWKVWSIEVGGDVLALALMSAVVVSF
ncbi:unannotated protein [freshwater metagenome]|uniref:Unannotated protein n=1 Tax=freshwater metagenome TaxID=449393 RepID=A0A6J7XPB1_9ZZZZ